jgi:hypothetical protein
MRSNVDLGVRMRLAFDKVLDELKLLARVIGIQHSGVVELVVQVGVEAEEVVECRAERYVVHVVAGLVESFLKSTSAIVDAIVCLTGVPSQCDHISAAPEYTSLGWSGCWLDWKECRCWPDRPLVFRFLQKPS